MIRRGWPFALFVLWWGSAPTAWTHRLDECLQALRVRLESDHLGLDIDLSPGAAVAEQVLVVLDRDADGKVSPGEATQYAEHLLRDISVSLDGHGLLPRVVSAEASPLAMLKEGDGRLRIRTRADYGLLLPGSHVLELTNRHLPEISVYLVNATKPVETGLVIGRQTRNRVQSQYRLEFEKVAAVATNGPSSQRGSGVGRRLP